MPAPLRTSFQYGVETCPADKGIETDVVSYLGIYCVLVEMCPADKGIETPGYGPTSDPAAESKRAPLIRGLRHVHTLENLPHHWRKSKRAPLIRRLRLSYLRYVLALHIVEMCLADKGIETD